MKGQEEVVKDRPCTVILVTRSKSEDEIVTVLPVTHLPPTNPNLAIEIPPATKKRLGLDEDRSWIVLSEANQFVWPGPDLRPAHSSSLESVIYGLLPQALFLAMRVQFLAVLKAGGAKTVTRSD